MSSNFTFLKMYQSELCDYCFFAEKYIHDDPDSSLVKLRKFSEAIVRELYAQMKVDDSQMNFYELTTHANFYNSVPDHIYKAINFLRVEGNKGAHPKHKELPKQASKEIALKALEDAYQISVWFIKQFYDKNIKIPDYVIPTIAQTNELMNRALQGDPDAQFSIGLKNYIGREMTAPDYKKAYYWFREASQQGHPRAQAYLASMYISERGIDKDTKAALKWLKRSIQQKEPIAQTLIGQMFFEGEGVEKNIKKAIYWLKKAAKNDDPVALCSLGQIYLHGEGIEKDPDAAFNWISRAAQYDDPIAFCTLGLLYEQGIGVTVNFQKAFEWYYKASEYGLPAAKAAVGAYYLKGSGCTKDIEKGLSFLKDAAEQGEIIAHITLGLFYKNEKTFNSLNESIFWLQKAAEKGNAEAQYELADSILLGQELFDVFPYSVSDARKWMVDAEKKGHPKASKVMEEIRRIRSQEVQNHNQLLTSLSAFRKHLKDVFDELEKINLVQNETIENITQSQDDHKKIGRNSPCPCGSGKKYKKCCLAKNGNY